MTALNKQALRQLATDAHELGIIKRYTKGIEANKRFVAIATPLTVLSLLDELETAEKRIAELEARDINIKRQAQALFEAIANPNDCYIPAYVRCLREALNGNSTGIGVKG